MAGTVRRFGMASLTFCAVAALSCSDPIRVEDFAVPQDAPAPSTARAACPERNVLREAYFGDLHVHTALSSDAAMYDVQLRPADAYRYAFGEPVLLPPLDDLGRSTREVRIDRPLDFAAVTDHAEFLAEGVLCEDPRDPAYDADFCQKVREAKKPEDLGLYIMNPWSRRDREVCGDDLGRCDQFSANVWQEVIDAAETWHDPRGRCEQTTFIAYEWSSFRLGSNFHRNVIFRNATVPRRPVSYHGRQARLGAVGDPARGHLSRVGHRLRRAGDSAQLEHQQRPHVRARLSPAHARRPSSVNARPCAADHARADGRGDAAQGRLGVRASSARASWATDDPICDFEKFAMMYDRFDRRGGRPATDGIPGSRIGIRTWGRAASRPSATCATR